MNFHPFGMELPCCRMNNFLMVDTQGYSEFSEEEIFNEMSTFGNVLRLELNPAYVTIQFSSVREAVLAEKFVLESTGFNGGLMMGPQGMMGAGLMNSGIVGGGMMGAPMMTGMMSPMMASGMMAGMNPSRSLLGAQMANRSTPNVLGQHPLSSRAAVSANSTQEGASPSNIQIIANVNGSRQISSFGQASGLVRKLSSSSVDPVEDQAPSRPMLEIGPCTLCLKRTSYTCGRCGIFYCSRECQVQNWPDHKTTCNSMMPPLNFSGKKDFSEISPASVDNNQPGRGYLKSILGSERDLSSQRSARDGGNRQSANDRLHQGPYRRSFDGTNERNEHNSNYEKRGAGFSSRGPSGSGPQQDREPQTGDSRNGGSSDRQSGERSRARSNFGSRDGVSADFGEKKTLQSPRSDDDKSGRQECVKQVLQSEEPEASGAALPDVGSKRPGVCKMFENLKVSSVATPVPITDSVALPKSEEAHQMQKPAVAVPSENNTKPSNKSTNEARTGDESYARQLLNPSFIPISSGDQVVLTHFSDSKIYLRSLQKEHLQQLVDLTETLQAYCASAEPFPGLPRKNGFVAAKFKADGQFYRAIVQKVLDKTEKKFEVNFVDFGNSDAATPADMVALTNELAAVPCSAVPTVLENMSEEILSLTAAKDILNKYFIQETPLRVEFTGSIINGVILKADDGTVVNTQILNAAAPAPPAVLTPPATPSEPAALPSAPVATVTCPQPGAVPAATPNRIMSDRLSYVEFPAAGSKCSILINSINETQGFLMACPVDDDAINAAAELTGRLEQHAEKSGPYIPVEDELCVVKWTDDCWYRAMVLTVEVNDSFHVLFLEYGNEDRVKSSNIRPFNEELLKVKALSSPCCLSGVELTTEKKAKLKSMAKDGWVVDGSVAMMDNDGLVHLEIPEITSAL